MTKEDETINFINDFITTYTGVRFTPLNPDKEQICIFDIAHSLSLLCRANGHCQHFYSVAQHCVNCAKEAKARGFSPRVQLACLLHDGSEAYISDITRPVKKNLKQYIEIEKHLQEQVYERFLFSPLTEEEIEKIGQIDDDILIWEFKTIMARKIEGTMPSMKSNPVFDFIPFEEVEKEFMDIFQEAT